MGIKCIDIQKLCLIKTVNLNLQTKNKDCQILPDCSSPAPFSRVSHNTIHKIVGPAKHQAQCIFRPILGLFFSELFQNE
jgi:hypothetical protein